MKVINNGKQKDIIVLTYFELQNKREYILYTVKQDTKEIILYLSNVKKMETVISLLKPEQQDLPLLQELIKNFLQPEIDLSILVKNKFKFIEPTKLEDIKVKEIGFKPISIPERIYEKLLINKYLTYPTLKIMNMDEIERLGYDKNNEEAFPASVLILLIYTIMIIIFQIILMFAGVNTISLFNFNAVTLTLSSLIIALISMAAFNFEEKEPLESWSLIYLIIFIFMFLLSLIIGKMTLIKTLLNALAISITFAIPYVLAKKVSFAGVNKLRTRNYVTYYIFYLIMFGPTIVVMTIIYSKMFTPLINCMMNILPNI